MGLFVAVLALYIFKDFSDAIALHLIIGSFSLTDIMAFFIFILALSLYFYAVTYIRYGFPHPVMLRIFKITEFLAKFFYSFAMIIYPIFIMIILFLSYLTVVLSKINFKLDYFTFVSIMILFLLSNFIFVFSEYRRKSIWLKHEAQELKYRFEEDLKTKRYQLNDEKAIKWRVIRIYRNLITVIKTILASKTETDLSRFSDIDILKLAKNEELITLQDFHLVNEIRLLRNALVHSKEVYVSGEELLNILNRVEKLLEHLK